MTDLLKPSVTNLKGVLSNKSKKCFCSPYLWSSMPAQRTGALGTALGSRVFSTRYLSSISIVASTAAWTSLEVIKCLSLGLQRISSILKSGGAMQELRQTSSLTSK